MNFLPENYEAPRSSNYYLKMQEGENRVRILSAPIIGWEDWTADKKPFRFTFDNKPLKSFDAAKPVKHFWAFIVFNYNEEQIQIMHVTQATIRKKIESLCKDKDWGAPYNYDIKIIKSGEKVDTEYVVNPVPHKPVDPYILQCFRERPCNLEAIFINADPFSNEWDKFTPLGFKEVDSLTDHFKHESAKMNEVQINDLKKIFNECDPAYQSDLLLTLKKLPIPVNGIEDVPPAIFDRIKQAVQKKRDEHQAMLSQTQSLFAEV